jgi:hypothetical protein
MDKAIIDEIEQALPAGIQFNNFVRENLKNKNFITADMVEALATPHPTNNPFLSPYLLEAKLWIGEAVNPKECLEKMANEGMLNKRLITDIVPKEFFVDYPGFENENIYFNGDLSIYQCDMNNVRDSCALKSTLESVIFAYNILKEYGPKLVRECFEDLAKQQDKTKENCYHHLLHEGENDDEKVSKFSDQGLVLRMMQRYSEDELNSIYVVGRSFSKVREVLDKYRTDACKVNKIE